MWLRRQQLTHTRRNTQRSVAGARTGRRTGKRRRYRGDEKKTNEPPREGKTCSPQQGNRAGRRTAPREQPRKAHNKLKGGRVKAETKQSTHKGKGTGAADKKAHFVGNLAPSAHPRLGEARYLKTAAHNNAYLYMTPPLRRQSGIRVLDRAVASNNAYE